MRLRLAVAFECHAFNYYALRLRLAVAFDLPCVSSTAVLCYSAEQLYDLMFVRMRTLKHVRV